MEAIQKFVTSHKEEVKRRKEEKKRKKEMQAPFSVRAKHFTKSFLLIAFYTLFFASFAYVLVIFCTTMIPTTISVILLGLGYKLDTIAELFLGSCAGLFFTAWVFTFSFVVVKKAFGIYWGAVKKQLPKKKEQADEQSEAESSNQAVSGSVGKQPIKMKKK